MTCNKYNLNIIPQGRGGEKYLLDETDNMMRIYNNLDFIRIWNDIFFISKNFITNEVKSSNNIYTINLIITLFSYFEYESFNNIPNEFGKTLLLFGKNEPEKLEKYILEYLNYDDKFFNVNELSISAINKIITLFKIGANHQFLNISGGKSGMSVNILNHLYIKKENSSEVDCSINLFENFKEMINRLLFTGCSPLKIQVLQFLILVSNCQQGFISLFMDDSKTKLSKVKYYFFINR